MHKILMTQVVILKMVIIEMIIEKQNKTPLSNAGDDDTRFTDDSILETPGTATDTPKTDYSAAFSDFENDEEEDHIGVIEIDESGVGGAFGGGDEDEQEEDD